MRAPSIVLVDAGTGRPAEALIEIVDRNLIVTRPCYLGLMKGVRTDQRARRHRPDQRTITITQLVVGRTQPQRTDRRHHRPPPLDRTIRRRRPPHRRSPPPQPEPPTAITRPDPEPTALDRWRALDGRRHSPDVDYGMQWRAADSDEAWRVSWNRGSGALLRDQPRRDRRRGPRYLRHRARRCDRTTRMGTTASRTRRPRLGSTTRGATVACTRVSRDRRWDEDQTRLKGATGEPFPNRTPPLAYRCEHSGASLLARGNAGSGAGGDGTQLERVTCVGLSVKAFFAGGSGPMVLVRVERPQRSEDERP